MIKNLKRFSQKTRNNIYYYMYMIPVMVMIFIFSYIPLYGILIAFQDYKVGAPFVSKDTVWVGLKHFINFASSYYFTRIVTNTLWLNLLGLVLGFITPIVFALFLNEIIFDRFKKTIQTVSYMPHFISSVVVAGMFLNFIGNDGLIPNILSSLGYEVKSLNINNTFFPIYYVLIGVWKSFGWGSILYLSTITGVDPELYDAAAVDGAGRWKKMWHITLPALRNLIIIQLIFNIGGLMSSNTEMILLMYNPSLYESMDVIGTYVYRDSLLGGRYSYGTASGLLVSVMSFALVSIANRISRKVADFSLW